MPATHPFTGLVVIDFTHVLAGPACSHYLGLLGAKVIKVESPQKGDAIRHRGGTDSEAAASGMSTSYLTQGGGKSSITLDLETEAGSRHIPPAAGKGRYPCGEPHPADNETSRP